MKAIQVLLLTNDLPLQRLITGTLAQIGAVTYLATDVNEALAKLCRGIAGFDLGIIDFQQGAHGLTLLSALKSCRRDLPVVAIIKHGDKHIEALAFATGAAQCLLKPLTSYTLATAIHDLLDSIPHLIAA